MTPFYAFLWEGPYELFASRIELRGIRIIKDFYYLIGAGNTHRVQKEIEEIMNRCEVDF